jgi:hypothetical protein
MGEAADRIEIGDLLIRYTRAIDTRDYELLDSCFAPDAQIDYTSSGGIAGAYPEVRAWLEKALAPFSAMMHFVGNTTLELDGDRARARTYVINPMGLPKSDGDLLVFTVYAHYVDRLERTPDGWRIVERIEEEVLKDGLFPPGIPVPR